MTAKISRQTLRNVRPAELAQVAISLAKEKGEADLLNWNEETAIDLRDDHVLRSYFWRARGVLLAAANFLANEASGRNARAKAFMMPIERAAVALNRQIPKRISLDEAGHGIGGEKSLLPRWKNANSIRCAIRRLQRKGQLPAEFLRFAGFDGDKPLAQWEWIMINGSISEDECKALMLAADGSRTSQENLHALLGIIS